MRIVFMGTPEFAVPSLKALSSRHETLLVITQPDKPAGRGQKLKPPPVKAEALRLGLSTIQPEDANHPDVLARIEEMRPQVIAVVAYGCILKRSLLEAPSIAPVNLHASLLPKYRGVSPINRAIMDGETVTGVTTMRMDEGIDTGPMLLQRRVEIAPGQTAGELGEALAAAGAGLFLETVDRLEAGALAETPQDDSQATYAKKLKKSDGVVPWDMPPVRVVNHVRGVTPWPGAVTYFDGQPLKVLEAGVLGAAVQEAAIREPAVPVPSLPEGKGGTAPPPGTITGLTENGPIVAAGGGFVVLRAVCPQGKRPMAGASWARGKRDLIGRLFSSRA